MIEQPFIRFLRLAAVRLFAELLAEDDFGCGVFRDSPAVAVSVFVKLIDKIAYQHIAFRLKACDYRVKSLFAVLAVTSATLDVF